MKKKKLMYVHGYNGSADASSCRLFRKYMPADEWAVYGLDYNQDDCAIALKQIRDAIEREGVDLVVGSSLGGFLTLLTTGIQRIVINPCYSPSVELPKLGPNNGLPAPSVEMVATYAAFEPQLKQMTDDDRRLITAYFAEDDELLGDTYWDVFNQDIGWFDNIPGGHHVSEEAVKRICYEFTPEHQLIKKAHQATFKNKESILRSKICGCFSCMKTFPPDEVVFMRETDGQETAGCPYCYTDAVLGDADGFPITTEFLQKMHKEWF